MPSTPVATKRFKPTPRILVVDDTLFVRKYLAQDLRNAGYLVETAESGERALELARKNPPDVVLADVFLGEGISGLDLARALRTDLVTARAFIVLISAHYAPDRIAVARHAGCDRFLVTPFASELVVDMIEQLIDAPDVPRAS
jgi:CheY-like chemotaxis protein